MRGLGGKSQQTLFLNKYKVSGMVSCVAPRTQLSSQPADWAVLHQVRGVHGEKGASNDMLVVGGDHYRT